MILYLDTSAMVKVFVDEPGAEAVRSAMTTADGCFTHLIAYAETRATFARALRAGRETTQRLIEHKREFEALWSSLGILAPDERMIRRAGDLAEQFGLRGYDSVHLAAAEVVWQQGSEIFRLIAFDRHLVDAGEALGMTVLGSD